MFDKIVSFYMTKACNNLIINEQHGFMDGRSTTSNLLICQHRLIEAVNTGSQVDSIHTEFSKAFDRVDHKHLISKLSHMGFGREYLEWLSSFLTGRTQCVRINNFCSKEFPVSSGAPQGSHCGPLLFNLFINDIKDSLKDCKFLIFADDLKFYRPVSRLDCLLNWSLKNKLFLNISKCLVISFFKSRKVCKYDYFTGSSSLKHVDEVRGLVIFDTTGFCLAYSTTFI